MTNTPETLNILTPDFRMPEHCGGDRWSILHGDSLQILRQFEPNSFDAIITDPPYASGLLDAALKKIIQFDILAEGGIIICETAGEKTLEALPEPYFVGREYKYGKVKLTVCGKAAR